MSDKKHVFIGFDPPHPDVWRVAMRSVRGLGYAGALHSIDRPSLEAQGLYRRPTSRRDGKLWDDISGASMATEFAIARFFAPFLCNYEGFALFMDCDMLLTDYAPLGEIFRNAKLDQSKAVWCVQHPETDEPLKTFVGSTKMDGQTQTYYRRKNWSSFMLFNCAHPANKALNLEMLNQAPGRDLHGFSWLGDDEIGELAPGWNWLIGLQRRPAILYNRHWTLAGPWLPNVNVPDAEVWHKALSKLNEGEANANADISGIQGAERTIA